MNRETYPSSLFPLRGDLSAESGATSVVVTGIQEQPVDPTVPLPQQLLVYGSDGVWHPEDPVVSGPDDVGSVATKPPVQVGGIADGGIVEELHLDTAGGIRSLNIESLLGLILQELRGIKSAIISLDNTANDRDFDGSQFPDN